MFHSRWSSSCAGAVFAFLLCSCGKAAAPGGGPVMGMPPAAVTVAAPIVREEADWAEATGIVEAVAVVELRPQVAGMLRRVAFADGARVAEGDLLYEIDDRPFQAALASAEAAAAEAAARAEQGRREAGRADGLAASGAVSPELTEQRNAALAVAEAAQAAAAAALELARLELGYCRVSAPIAGRIGRNPVTAGNLVGPAGPALATLIATDPVRVAFDLDERTWAAAQALYADAATAPGISIAVDGVGQELRARLEVIDNRIDPGSGTIRLRAGLANADGRLIPGAYAKVRLPVSAAQPRLLVAEHAILSEQGRRFVYVAGADGQPVQRRVVPGQARGALRIVSGELQAGEAVVINGMAHLMPGRALAPVQGSMDPTAGAAGTGGAAAPAAGAAAAPEAREAATP